MLSPKARTFRKPSFEIENFMSQAHNPEKPQNWDLISRTAELHGTGPKGDPEKHIHGLGLKTKEIGGLFKGALEGFMGFYEAWFIGYRRVQLEISGHDGTVQKLLETPPRKATSAYP